MFRGYVVGLKTLKMASSLSVLGTHPSENRDTNLLFGVSPVGGPHFCTVSLIGAKIKIKIGHLFCMQQ